MLENIPVLLVILTNNWLFSDITSCYLKITSCSWLKENNRLLFSVTGIDDDQGLGRVTNFENELSNKSDKCKVCKMYILGK